MRNWSAAITLACLAAIIWLTWHEVMVPPSIIAIAGVSVTTWLVSAEEYKRRRAEAVALAEKLAADAIDWCEGCDQLRPRAQMGLNSIWLYRCRECRTGEVEVVPGHYRTAEAHAAITAAALVLPDADGCLATGPPGGPFVVTDWGSSRKVTG